MNVSKLSNALRAACRVAVMCVLAAPAFAQTPPADQGARAGDAYSQFMLGRHYETADDIPNAIAAFKRGIQLDPQGADIIAELAGLYMRQSRLDEAVQAGEQALKVQPANREAHRVLGIVYATLIESGRRNARTQQNATSMAENLSKAIEHLENAIDRQLDSDPNVRATLSRLYLAADQNEKAIPLLQDLVSQEPGWSDGPTLLAQAYAGAGRDAEAITWLEKSAADDPTSTRRWRASTNGRSGGRTPPTRIRKRLRPRRRASTSSCSTRRR